MEEFIDALLGIIKEDMMKVFIREMEEPDYLNQKEFSDSKTPCLARAIAGIDESTKRAKNTLGLAIALSREAEYNDDTMDEQAALLASEDGISADVAQMGFWNQ